MKINLLVIMAFAALSLSAQPKISFEKTMHDFGKVGEGDGAVSHDFIFKNTGTAPLIIQNVKTTCGCTTPEWTKQPVRPGETGFIKVTYDVKGRPGAIDKTITVHSNCTPPLVDLRITGDVVPVERHPSEEFRHSVGNIRLNEMQVDFSQMYSGEKSSLVVMAYNPSAEAVKISFVDLPPFIKVDVSPATVKKGEKAKIIVTYDAAKKNDWGFVYDQISMILNDKKDKEYKLAVTATIKEDFSRLTISQLQNAPSVAVEKQTVDGGKIKAGEKKTFKVKLTNNGKSNLLIRKVDVGSSKAITADAPKEIGAGASADLTVTFDASGQSGEQNKAITIITNDPKNPQVTIRLKAEVTE